MSTGLSVSQQYLCLSFMIRAHTVTTRVGCMGLPRLPRVSAWENVFGRPNIVPVGGKRCYAKPANLQLPPKLAFRPPPPPIQPSPTLEDGHSPGEVPTAAGSFDHFIEQVADESYVDSCTPVSTLFQQYRDRAGRVIDLVIPYEERPLQHRRADTAPDGPAQGDPDAGDGLVMIIHALRKSSGKLDKICACSGFVIEAQQANGSKTDTEILITCAHTLEEMSRKLPLKSQDETVSQSFSFAISSTGRIFFIDEVISSMPKSDLIAVRAVPADQEASPRLRTLPITPFPVRSGGAVLTHLFEASNPPEVRLSTSRLPPRTEKMPDKESAEKPFRWLQDQAWRRWGAGTMLGYRSYTGIEVEAGIHSSLPHILTSVLPTPGSSGGPLVCVDTGSVVGMISGRRMDNRVEGERGWGSSSEGIFEMFSLPGLAPQTQV